jgi:hypothetical protein
MTTVRPSGEGAPWNAVHTVVPTLCTAIFLVVTGRRSAQERAWERIRLVSSVTWL